ncbi:ABC transporter permease [Streptomyces sp. NPDC127084]|uniref:ABC transporter permease n=1 Tax=Streptomyces sp. NPDC127084 TaxID=3347133 RepID=UPI003656A8C6
MSTTTQAVRADGGSPMLTGRRKRTSSGFGLRGMTWLVWRQHRMAFLLLLGVAAATTAGLAWLAQEASSAVAAVKVPNPSPAATTALNEAYQLLDSAGLALVGLPVIIGLFIGAPLFAGDLETGTAKFVGVQSRSRWTWVATKLGMAALFAAAAALSTGFAMKAMLTPLVNHMAVNANFTDAGAFDTTGPTAVAWAVLGVLTGAAAGLLARRTLPAMVVTLGVLLAVKVGWELVRLMFAPTVVKTTSGGRVGEDDAPEFPANALEIDTSFVTGDGTLLGWSTCANATDRVACLRGEGAVGWYREYLPFSHMEAMQWAASGALAGLILLTAGVLVYGARRALR